MEIGQHLKNLSAAQEVNDKFLHVTAYENRLSKTARSFMESRLSDRYYFGGGDEDRVINWDPFTTLGQPAIENIVEDAERAVKVMLGGEIVNLRCLSGVHAMMCAILVATNPGDTVMIVHHDDGGHFSTQPILERSGRKVAYIKFDTSGLVLDVDATLSEFNDKQCKAVYLDMSYPVYPFNIRGLRRAIGDEATIIYDASHTIGLMMGGQFQNPFDEGADIICANTHKTLPGPHKGMLVFKDKQNGEALNGVINNGLFSTSHAQHLVALAITILEVEKFGVEYARQIVSNSNALGRALSQLGYDVRSLDGVYSATHQVHLFLPVGIVPHEAYRQFIKNMISTNFDNRLGGRLFARLGTQELTRRGMKEADMEHVAHLIHASLQGDDVRGAVEQFNSRFPDIYYSFDSVDMAR